jgi:proteasome lid subunit RPN8/RPN11
MSAKPEPKVQEMPMDRSILWNPPAAPGARSSGRAPYPIFFQQEAVIALQEHLKSSPTQAIFGFLIGDVYRDPETGVLYTIIDKTLRLSQAIYGDKTEVVVGRLWDRMQEQLTRAAGVLLGWYHSHPGQGGYLTAHDVETHDKYFTDPWQVAVLVAAEAGGVTGRFFRAGQNDDWHKTPLAFYELLQPESIKPDGKKRSFITWRNYKAYTPSLTGPKPKPAPAPEPPPPPEPPPKPPPKPLPPPRRASAPVREEPEEGEEEVEEADAPDEGFRIMRGSADDIPVLRSSADDEPAPPSPPPPPRPPRKSGPKPRPAAPPEPKAPPPPPPRKSDDLPWAVTPESVASIPPPVMPLPPPPAPREPRRTPTHPFRLLDQEAETKPVPKARRRRKRRNWLGKIVLLLVLATIGAGAYWYFKIRDPRTPPPWAGLVDRVKRLVKRSPSPPPPAARRSPAPRVTPPPPANPYARFDRLSDSLTRAVRSFHDRATLFTAGRIDCAALAQELVAIENLWITYNAERRARMATFDLRHVTRDQAQYAAVDSVESRFEQSGCRRP